MNDKSKVLNIWEKSIEEKVTKRLSFSQYKVWSECPHLHYLISIAKEIPYPDNDYTAYGSPFHETLEKKMLEKALGLSSSDEDNFSFFLEKYQRNIEEILDDGMEEEEFSGEKVVLFANAAKQHFQNIDTFLKKEFGEYKVVAVELDFIEPIDIETDLYKFVFRGSMDLVIETSDGVHHIIDWKTSLRGWSDYKKEESVFLDQLLFYKHFYSQISKIPFDKIQSHFIIFESQSEKIDHITMHHTKNDLEELFKRVRTMIYNAFEARRYIKTAMCGNFCDCKKYYLELTEKE